MPAADTPARRVLRNVAFRTVAEVGAKVSTIALFTVMGRTLGDEGVGLFAFALSVGALAATLADFGQDKVLTREVSRDHDTVSHYYANVTAVRLVVGLPLLAVAVLAVPAFGYGADAQLALLLVGAGILIDLLANTAFAVFQSFERIGYLSVILLIERWFLAVGGIVALLTGQGVVAVSAVFLASSFVALFLATRLLRRVTSVTWRLEPRSWVPLMRASAPLGIAGLFGTILFRIDTAILAAMTTADVVGNYGAAYRLFETTLFVSWSINTAFYPVFSRQAGEGGGGAVRSYEQAVKMAVAAVLPVAVGFAVLADPLVRLVFGNDFERAGRALVVLAPAVAVYPVSYLSGYLAISHNRERSLTALYGVVALENVAMNLVLIPMYSLTGAAISTTVSEVLALIGALVIVRRTVGRVDWGRAVGSAVVAAAVAGAVMWVLREMPVAAAGAGALVYVALLLGIEQRRHPGDVRALRDMARRG